MNRIIILFFCLFLLSGCATIDLSPQNRKLVHAIKIDHDIDMPLKMYFDGGGAQYTAILGSLGSLLSANVVDKDTREIIYKEKQNKIDFKKILITQLTRQLESFKEFSVVRTHPDAVLSLKVRRYGFQATGLGFSSKLTPFLVVKAWLIRKNKIIWLHRATAYNVMDRMPSYTYREMIEDPERIRQMWVAATQIVARKLVRKLVE